METSWEARMAERARARVTDAHEADEQQRRAAIRSTVLPPAAPGLCAHGIEHGRGGLVPLFESGGAVATGIDECECCQSPYGYISSGWYGVDSSGHFFGSSHDDSGPLCHACR